MIAVAEFGIGAKCSQQSLLQNIFGVVAAQSARVPHQLVAMLLDEEPERRKTIHAVATLQGSVGNGITRYNGPGVESVRAHRFMVIPMVLASGRAYSDLVQWMRSARPPGMNLWLRARRDFTSSLITGTVVLGLIGLFDPESFGAPQSDAFASGRPSTVLGGLMVLCAVLLATRAGRIRRAAMRAAEPWLRPLYESPAWPGASSALAACAAGSRARFALAWVWGPIALVVIACTFSWSTAYFVVDAILAGGRIGWGQPLYAVGFALLSLVTWRLVEVRLATWRLAASIHREATEGF